MRRQAGRIIVNRLMTPPVGASNWLYLSLVVMGLDQLTKYYIVEQLDLFDRVSLFFWLDITRLHNTGAAFSFLSDAGGWQRWLFIVLGIGVSVAIVFWLRRVPRRGHAWLAIALALIVGGALGNVIDRAIYGYVVDFISVHYADWYFPAFNLADSCISVGAAMLVIDSLFLERKREAGSGKREGTVTGDRGPGTGREDRLTTHDSPITEAEREAGSEKREEAAPQRKAESGKRKVQKKTAAKKKRAKKKKKKTAKTSDE